jgi:hypothetical protein
MRVWFFLFFSPHARPLELSAATQRRLSAAARHSGSQLGVAVLGAVWACRSGRRKVAAQGFPGVEGSGRLSLQR